MIPSALFLYRRPVRHSLGDGGTLGASPVRHSFSDGGNIEKATVASRKEVRGAAGETKAETATRDAKDAAALSVAEALTTSPFAASESAPSTLNAQPSTLNAQPSTGAKRTYTAEEKRACSIEAMKNGEICEACQ